LAATSLAVYFPAAAQYIVHRREAFRLSVSTIG